MKKLLFEILCLVALVSNAAAYGKTEKIRYDYNHKGQYVPVSVGNKKIRYDYNHKGQYVPVGLE